MCGHGLLPLNSTQYKNSTSSLLQFLALTSAHFYHLFRTLQVCRNLGIALRFEQLFMHFLDSHMLTFSFCVVSTLCFCVPAWTIKFAIGMNATSSDQLPHTCNNVRIEISSRNTSNHFLDHLAYLCPPTSPKLPSSCNLLDRRWLIQSHCTCSLILLHFSLLLKI